MSMMGKLCSLFACKNRTQELTAVMDRETDAYNRYMDEARALRIQTRSSGTYLILEDDASISKLLQVIIASCGRKAHAVYNLHEAVDYLDKHGAESLACCVVDLRLPDGDGETLINLIEQRYSDVPVVVYTGSTERISALQAAHPKVRIMRKGIHDGVKNLMRVLSLPDRAVQPEMSPS
jgi:CheY-like chemotaxis protein